MKKRMLAVGVVACVAGMVSARTFDVTEFGAKADGTTDNTAAIQKAIDACHAAGGGMVLVPGGGTYVTYTLNLKSNVRLEIDRGATLLGGADALKYPEFGPSDYWNVDRVPRFNKRALFYTVAQTNVAITGRGTVDGNADSFHEPVPNPRPGQPKFRRKSDTLITGRSAFFVACKDVQLEDFLFYHPCGWCTWFLDCDRVQVRGVRIECHPQYPNGDGLHFGGCRDVTVSDCIIHSQDDSLIIRTHQEQMKVPRPCERVTINNCVLSANQSAIRFGWTEDYDAKKGILPPTGPILPFFVENVSFSNMRIDSVNAPIQVTIANTEKVDFIRNISFSNCRFTSGLPPVFECRAEDNVSDWRFSNVEFVIEKGKAHQAMRKNGGLFENCTGFTFDNVKWTYR